ncbi:MAG: hypothetical protein NWF05_07605 [Candidatus Bathyarchaeota archaeon]|nr:hypothetical protein [Candidatus Bathyarchaeota archaeon]
MTMASLDKDFAPNPAGSLQDYNKLLFESIDEGLSTLGEPSKSALYDALDRSFNLKKTDIIFRTGDFYNALNRIFGSGAVHLQRLFMKNFSEKTGCSCVAFPL